jgi:dihydroorotate dehydrogenase electron transfer subunit
MEVMLKTYIPHAAAITKIEPLNENTKMYTLDLSLGCLPGQFVNLWIPEVDEKPFSVAYDDGHQIKIAIAKVGPFTETFFQNKVGDKVGIRGPYGNTFRVLEDKNVVLVGGGFGSAPLHFLGENSKKNGCEITMIIGARTKNLLMYEEISKESGFRVFTTTNDGSAGEEGFVTLPLERILQTESVDMVQTCGPEKMMEVVARLCKKYKVPAELSLERYMKCGFGVCGQCACGNKLVCADGCIFSGEEALSLEDFGQFHRGPEGQKEYF